MKGVKIDGTSLLLGLVLGAGAGAISGWFLARRKMEPEIAKEVAGVKAYYADKAAADPAGDGDHADAAGVTATLGIRVETENIRPLSDAERALLAARKGDLAEISLGFVPGERDEVGEDDADDDDADEGIVLPATPLRDTTVPYVISAGEHDDEGLEFSKVSLTWWSLDGVLTDERDSPLDDTSIAGDDFFTKFGQESEDPSIVFIRNERLTLDMEIVLKEASFAETVLGYGKPNA